MLKIIDLPSFGIGGIKYVTVNPRFREIYWREVTQIVRHELGVGKFTDPAIVRSMLEELLAYLLDEFQRVALRGRDLSFLVFVHGIHESSVTITQLAQNNHPDIIRALNKQDRRDLPGVRRILKLALEEILFEQFAQEMTPDVAVHSQATTKNVALLEELLYLGIWALELKESINACAMYPKAIALQSSWKEMLTVTTTFPYDKLLQVVNQDIISYPNVHYESLNDELDTALQQDFGSSLTHFLDLMPGKSGSGVIPREEFLREIGYEGAALEQLRPFYTGLTLSVANKLPLAESFKKTQLNARLIYRPIIEFKDRHGNDYWLVGRNKTLESRMVLQTSAMLWGELPREWYVGEHTREFVQRTETQREESMMAQIAELLDRQKVLYRTSIKSMIDGQGQGVNIVKNGPGEIDLIFLDQMNKKVYVGECKNNRPRHEPFYLLSDRRYFVKKYEPQLVRKHAWISQHLELVQSHFQRHQGAPLDLTGWTVEGMFLLMSPSYYKYDGLFLALTVRDFDKFLTDDFSFNYPVFRFERKGKLPGEVHYPYFKNLNRMGDNGEL
jgi:hypothetical protein